MQVRTRKDGTLVATGSINHAELAKLQKKVKAPVEPAAQPEAKTPELKAPEPEAPAPSDPEGVASEPAPELQPQPAAEVKSARPRSGTAKTP